MTNSTEPTRSAFRSPGLLALFAFLAILTAAGLLGLDRMTADFMRQHEPAWAYLTSVALSLVGGSGLYPIMAAVFLVWSWRRPDRRLWRTCLWVLTAEAACCLLVRVFKIGFGRWRPNQVLGGQFEFFQLFKSKCHSFPSGHTGDAAAVAAVLWFACPRLRPLCVAWVVLMASARIGASQHFVADAATGAACGILCALMVGRKLDVIGRWIEGLARGQKSEVSGQP